MIRFLMNFDNSSQRPSIIIKYLNEMIDLSREIPEIDLSLNNDSKLTLDIIILLPETLAIITGKNELLCKSKESDIEYLPPIKTDNISLEVKRVAILLFEFESLESIKDKFCSVKFNYGIEVEGKIFDIEQEILMSRSYEYNSFNYGPSLMMKSKQEFRDEFSILNLSANKDVNVIGCQFVSDPPDSNIQIEDCTKLENLNDSLESLPNIRALKIDVKAREGRIFADRQSFSRTIRFSSDNLSFDMICFENCNIIIEKEKAIEFKIITNFPSPSVSLKIQLKCQANSTDSILELIYPRDNIFELQVDQIEDESLCILEVKDIRNEESVEEIVFQYDFETFREIGSGDCKIRSDRLITINNRSNVIIECDESFKSNVAGGEIQFEFFVQNSCSFLLHPISSTRVISATTGPSQFSIELDLDDICVDSGNITLLHITVSDSISEIKNIELEYHARGNLSFIFFRQKYNS
ncbi:MAG: hypothetical protein MHMPM18_004015 [Marteilia pararefringens]